MIDIATLELLYLETFMIYRISEIVCERKPSQYVNYHSDCKKMFTNLDSEEILQENVCEYTKTHEIHKHFFHEQFLIYGT